jgi:hypothetical protein
LTGLTLAGSDWTLSPSLESEPSVQASDTSDDGIDVLVLDVPTPEEFVPFLARRPVVEADESVGDVSWSVSVGPLNKTKRTPY